MAIDSFPRVEELTIARFVGPLALSRGRNYARAGSVAELNWDAPQHRLTATVQGTENTPYRCSVSLDIGSAGRTTILGSTCSCPVGFTCKHAAAALFAANEAAKAAAAAAVESQRVVAGPVDDGWRGDIAAITAHTRAASVPGSLSASGAMDAGRRGQSEHPLALQFELRQRTARRRDDWQAPRDATAGDSTAVERLAVRPVTLGARGSWIKGALTWQNIGFQGGAGGFDSQKARWFAQFSVLKGPVHGGYLNFGSDWISLDDFESSLLWALLTDADRLGIPLVGSGPTPTIRVADSASIGLDASFGSAGPRTAETADAADTSALTLTPAVLIDGVPHPTDQVRLIGAHGVYHYDFEHGVITLARLSSPVTPEQRAVVERQRPVQVPQSEVAEFLETHFGTLARTLRVVSSDASFTPPPLKPATLVLTARFEAGHVLRLHWEWSLSDGRRAPLTAPDSEFHDPVAERAVVSAVEAILRDDVAGSLALGGPVSSALTTGAAGTASAQASAHALPGQRSTGLRASVVLRSLDAAEFSARILPELERVERLHIDIVGQQPDYREVVEAPVLTVSAVETEENDWFDLGVVVSVEGRTVPFGPLFTALSNGRRKLLLVDNSYLSLDQPVFEPLRELIEEAGTLPEWEAGIRISRYQTDLWDEFEELADVSEAAAAWQATVEGLRDLDAIEPLDAPSGLAIELRHYQLEGFRWLAFLHRHSLGGILADDMGLGKTAQTLALITHVVEQSSPDAAPFLVVAPTSVLSNWATEAARFTPDLTVVTIDATQGKTGRRLADAAAGADIVLTTYAILRIDAEVFADLEWGGLVLDEAQFAKNHTSKVHQAARGIRAPFRLAVTGTPMENNLMELWALFQIVAPGLFPSARLFTEKYRRPIEGDHNVERLAKLRRRIRPLMLRRSKELVAPELPPKQEQVLSIELDPRHRRIYDTHLQRERQKLLGLIDDLDRNRFIVFRSLTLLRMLSLDASLIDEEKYAGVPSAKLDALFEQLDDVVAEGHQALVFSQFTSFLQRAAARLDELGVPYAYLDGSTRSRGQVIERFRGGGAKVFLISLKAGGFGLNLTEADYVFLLDPWWNPASEAQAVDRAHRIGQDKTVMVYRMVASGTIEEKVMALKAKKAELVNSVMDDEALFSESLTADDIRGLLEA